MFSSYDNQYHNSQFVGYDLVRDEYGECIRFTPCDKEDTFVIDTEADADMPSGKTWFERVQIMNSWREHLYNEQRM